MKLVFEKSLQPSPGGFNIWHLQPGDVEPTECATFEEYEGWINQYTEDGIWKLAVGFNGSVENAPSSFCRVYELTNGGLPLGYMLAWLGEVDDE